MISGNRSNYPSLFYKMDDCWKATKMAESGRKLASQLDASYIIINEVGDAAKVWWMRQHKVSLQQVESGVGWSSFRAHHSRHRVTSNKSNRSARKKKERGTHLVSREYRLLGGFLNETLLNHNLCQEEITVIAFLRTGYEVGNVKTQMESKRKTLKNSDSVLLYKFIKFILILKKLRIFFI